MKEKIENIEKVLFGNGRKGVVERLIRIEVQIWIVYGGLAAVIGLLLRILFK